jgi:50S ribosomal protein L16 3-hydroxylase
MFMVQNCPMNPQTPLTLLGGLSPSQFMRRHWQKKPLLVRQAVPGFESPIKLADLKALATQNDVESRLIVKGKSDWRLKHGPLGPRAYPARSQPDWTFLVQGVNLHDDRVHQFMRLFRFVPEARLDDVMISWASDGGGVGPHFDSYDVFLFQAQGRRRWRIGRTDDLSLQPGLPLKILRQFQPETEFVLEPGDMLYLPPRYAHDGVAEGECMTWSIGFRSASKQEWAREILYRLTEHLPDNPALYADAGQDSSGHPAQIPVAMHRHMDKVLRQALSKPLPAQQALGEWLTEPKAQVWFEPGEPWRPGAGVRLDRRSRMLYDRHFIFLNGESWRASGADARKLRQLADQGALAAQDLQRASMAVQNCLVEWTEAGWLQTE